MLKSVLAQEAAVTTNSRDTIYQVKISPTCDKLATCHLEALYRQQLIGSSAVSSLVGVCGRLVRGEGVEDLIRPRSKLTFSDLLSGNPTKDLVV